MAAANAPIAMREALTYIPNLLLLQQQAYPFFHSLSHGFFFHFRTNAHLPDAEAFRSVPRTTDALAPLVPIVTPLSLPRLFLLRRPQCRRQTQRLGLRAAPVLRGLRIAGADISRKSTSKSASFRFSNYTDFNLRLLACFYRMFLRSFVCGNNDNVQSIQLEYFKTLACYTYVGEGKLPNDPKDLPSAEEALSDPYFTGLANMTVNHPLNPFQNLSLNLREGN
ncbi:hypothetical protein glysoja_048106 [Glycine soja]|uniref:Uncharacterized protein n=1 Tax=Glycine soja TaxID=3848 RepID=A0A0B2QE21_GLYSO|nr:hypothetical protein glysoja_048106 [Glycine soja]